MAIELVQTDGIFALDGGEWEVTNNIWLVGDDREVVVIDAAHDEAPIVDAIKTCLGEGTPALGPAFQPEAAVAEGEVVARIRRILDEEVAFSEPIVAFICGSFHKLFPLGDPPDYEPTADRSVAAIAEREGRSPKEVAYDLLMQRDGEEMLYFPLFNYSDGNLDSTLEMLRHPQAAIGLSDGGAHCGVICDASTPTYVLTHWVRDRARGERIPLEWAVKKQTQDTAALYGLRDRGVLAPGKKADVNVIDFDNLRLRAPAMAFDLPAHGRRLVQRADGYTATLVAGEVAFEEGEPTGALPGKLVRGSREA